MRISIVRIVFASASQPTTFSCAFHRIFHATYNTYMYLCVCVCTFARSTARVSRVEKNNDPLVCLILYFLFEKKKCFFRIYLYMRLFSRDDNTHVQSVTLKNLRKNKILI